LLTLLLERIFSEGRPRATTECSLCEKILKENDGLGFSLVEFSIPSSSNLYVQLSTREALNTDIGIEEDPRSVESASFPAFHDARSRTSDDTMSKAKKKINGIAINPYKSYISVISVLYIKLPHPPVCTITNTPARVCVLSDSSRSSPALPSLPHSRRQGPRGGHGVCRLACRRQPKRWMRKSSCNSSKASNVKKNNVTTAVENDDSVCGITRFTQQYKSCRTSAGKPLPCRKRRRWSRRPRPWGSRRGSAGA
jgi:hypothetical protein